MSRRVLAVAAVAAITIAVPGCSASKQESSPRPKSTASQSSSPSESVTESPTSDGGHVKQRATLAMLPQIAQPGAATAKASAASSAMTATFEPASEGRTVSLQRRDGQRWTTVAKAEESAKGVAEFAAPYAVGGKPAVYRAHAEKSDGLGSVSSNASATSKWGPADFDDEFSRTQLGPDWVNRLQGYSAESLRKCSKADPRAVDVTDGVLRLSVMKDPDRTSESCKVDGKNYAWRINGHVGTQGTHSFTYGYAAARIKFQPLRGQHAAFWMQAASRQAEEGSASQTGAEIDVVEWFGQDDPHGGLTSFVYDYPDNGKDGVTGRKTGGYIKNPERFGDDWAKKFHVFSVEWTPAAYVFRIDGKETFRTTKGVSGQPEYLILSLLSSDYELPWMHGDNHLPQHMDVDWVRYWER